MEKRISRLFLATMLVVVSLFSQRVYAASLDDFDRVNGIECMTASEIEAVNKNLELVPDHIAELYNAIGGTITFQHGGFSEYPNACGTYTYATGDIAVAVDPDVRLSVQIQDIVTHELGHFLYNKTRSSWSDNNAAVIAKTYSKIASYDTDCTSEDESFALLYEKKRYRTLDDEAIIADAEAIAAAVLEKTKTKGTYGPGMFLD